jgi:2-methylcitrate dehydratase PrpD
MTLLRPTDQLAEFCARWRPPTGPSPATREATWVLVDFVGTALVGTGEPCSEIVAGVAREDGAPGPAIAIRHGFRTTATFAAFVNGTSGHALDYDDSGLTNGSGHPSVAVVPAALAIAERIGATGRQLLDSIVVGYEVMSRIGRCSGGADGDSYTRGFHGTGVYGVFGAAAATSRLLGLSFEQSRSALGIAASRSAGLRANSGTMTKPLHAGQASRAGLEAALLASRGFTASPEILETRAGWMDAFAGGSYEPSQLVNGLGESLVIEQGGKFKMFPSAGENHGAIHAVLQLMDAHRLEPSDIAEIHVSAAHIAATVTLLYPWPSTGLEGKFSLAYNVAAAWADRRVDVATFSDEKLRELERYRSRVHVTSEPGRPPYRVRARTVDGRELTCEQPFSRRDQPGGRISAQRDDLLREKFSANLAAVRSRRHAEELLPLLEQVEGASTLIRLTELMR